MTAADKTAAGADMRAKLAKRAQAQLGMLAAQFLLGMAVNLIGLPSEAEGGAKLATSIFLMLHMLLAVGLLVGAVRTGLAARKVTVELDHLAHFAAAGVGLTLVAGVLTVVADNDWWSYAMAAGFIATFWMYGVLFVRSRRPA